MSINLGQSLQSNISTAQNAIGSIGSAVNTAQNLKAALSSSYSSGGVLSAIRSVNIPAAGEAIGDIMSAVSSFGGDANSDDWRVRLSLASWVSFKSSPVLAPLKEAGGLIFPYTPQITIKSSATYTSTSPVHTNYAFRSYKNSDPGAIQIIAPMNVEDSTQALYWIAALHYLRSLTKMFTGNDPKAGNPPPVIYLNGYGNYVFKNVPVVVTNIDIQLNAECDYIGCNVVGSLAGEISGIADSLGSLSDTLGGSISGLSGLANNISEGLGIVGQTASVLGSLGIGGTTNGGVTHVPTKSTFTVTLQPVYSRDSARKFSLDRFVSGGYLNNSVGYI
jgi:hypothetical protein